MIGALSRALGARRRELPEALRRQWKVCWDWHAAQVFATSQRRMRSAISVAVASGTLVEYLPSRRTQYRPIDCRTSSMRCVGPPRFVKLMRTSAGSLGTDLTLQIL